MMTKCPECGSTEIVPDLILFADSNAGRGALFVTLVDPAKKGTRVDAGFRVSVYGACRHAEMHTHFYQDVLDAHKKGYSSSKLQ